MQIEKVITVLELYSYTALSREIYRHFVYVLQYNSIQTVLSPWVHFFRGATAIAIFLL